MKISYRPTRFCGHRHCGSDNIMVLACHVILQDHVIKGSCDFIGRSPSRKIIIQPSLTAIGTVVVKI